MARYLKNSVGNNWDKDQDSQSSPIAAMRTSTDVFTNDVLIERLRNYLRIIRETSNRNENARYLAENALAMLKARGVTDDEIREGVK
jgi:hypothetical protein